MLSKFLIFDALKYLLLILPIINISIINYTFIN